VNRQHRGRKDQQEVVRQEMRDIEEEERQAARHEVPVLGFGGSNGILFGAACYRRTANE
jgi:hypothetical protein